MATWSVIGTLRTRWDFAVGVADVIAPHVHDAVGEVHVEPAKGAQLAHAQAGERRGDVDRTVVLRAVGARDGVDLVGREDREVASAPDGDPLGVLGGVGVDPALALGALEDRVELDEDLWIVRRESSPSVSRRSR
jgi:hypothetical protein